MRNLIRARGLSDLRTATTARVRTKTRQPGTINLDLFLQSKEKQRLMKELAILGDRARCIQMRLVEIEKAIAWLEKEAQREKGEGQDANLPGNGEESPVPPDHFGLRQWRKITLSY